MRKTFIIFVLILAAALAGCASEEAVVVEESELAEEMTVNIQNPYMAQEGDAELNEGGVYVEAVVWDAETQTLTISGNLPTPCNDLRIDTTLEDGQINLKIYSLIEPESICAQVLEPFEAALVLENFSKDIFTIMINGEAVDL